MSTTTGRNVHGWLVTQAVLVALAAALTGACAGGDAAEVPGDAAAGEAAAGRVTDGSVYGGEVALGEGTARVYIEYAAGKPVEIGVALTEAALRGLPTDHDHTGVMMPDGHRMFEKQVAMPEQNDTQFRYVALGWNPAGHEPPGIYDLPHFDVHFYMTPDSIQRSMDPADPKFGEKAARLPEAQFMATGYVAAPPAVPFMGQHWVDPTSPELNGQVFTRTMIYGSWDGELIFIEPMITKAFLESRPQFSTAMPVPDRVAEPGYYPDGYSIRWDEARREWRIALTGLAWRSN